MEPMSQFLLSPILWWILLALWVWWAVDSAAYPRVSKKFDKRTAKPGDLFTGGSTATSGTEKKVLETLHKAGYKTYPSSTWIWTPKDANGVAHRYTPDIIVKKPKMIVEVDPLHWHGGFDRIKHDVDRNRMYAAMGYTILRVRIGGAQALSPNDVVIPEGDFDPKAHSKKLLRAVRSAKRLPSRHWNKFSIRI